MDKIEIKESIFYEDLFGIMAIRNLEKSIFLSETGISLGEEYENLPEDRSVLNLEQWMFDVIE